MKSKTFSLILCSPILIGCSGLPWGEHTLVLNANFVFNHVQTSDGEDLAKILFDSSYYNFPSEVKIDEPLVAGDQLVVVIGGNYDVVCAESYPAQCTVKGKLKDYHHVKTEIYKINLYNKDEIKNNYNLINEYVILDEEGRYTSLDEYSGAELYLSCSIKDVVDGSLSKQTIAGLYAYNPR